LVPDPRPPARFPSLPILNGPPPPGLGQHEKYGGLFYLGLAGLVLLLALVSWFAWNVWSLRGIFGDVYTLNDPHKPDPERILAAMRLAHSNGLADTQRLEMCLDRSLPDLARLILAEGVSADLVAEDPRVYALTVARSEGWPSWIRLALAFNIARGVIRGYTIPSEALQELAQNKDRAVAALGLFAQAAALQPDPQARAALQSAAADKTTGQFAALLLEVLDLPVPARERRLDEIAIWTRTGHEPSAHVWSGWNPR